MAKIVKKCGTRDYWEDWAVNIAEIAKNHITRLTSIYSSLPSGLIGSSRGNTALITDGYGSYADTEDDVDYAVQPLHIGSLGHSRNW